MDTADTGTRVLPNFILRYHLHEESFVIHAEVSHKTEQIYIADLRVAIVESIYDVAVAHLTLDCMPVDLESPISVGGLVKVSSAALRALVGYHCILHSLWDWCCAACGTASVNGTAVVGQAQTAI